MRGGALVVVAVLVSTAAADVQFQPSASLWGGYLSGESFGRLDRAPVRLPHSVVTLRLAAGVRGEVGADLGLTMGIVAELGRTWTNTDGRLNDPLTLSLAGELDRSLVRCWRVGLRGSLGAGRTSVGDGQVIVAGLRARNHALELGADVVLERRGDLWGRAHANGVLLGVGFHGRPARYAVPILAGSALLISLAVLFAFAGGSS